MLGDQHNGNDINHQSQDGLECCVTNVVGMIITTSQVGLECRVTNIMGMIITTEVRLD